MLAASRALYLIGGDEGLRPSEVPGRWRRRLDSTFHRFDLDTGLWTTLQLAGDELQAAVRNGPHNYIIPLTQHIFVSYIDEQRADDLTMDYRGWQRTLEYL